MIQPNKFLNFMMWYVSEKECGKVSAKERKALNVISYLNKKKKLDIALAIDIVSNKYELNKDSLHKNFRKRQSYISASKKVYPKFSNLLKEGNSKPKKLCECGCGQIVKNNKNRFINGHNVSNRPIEQKQLYAQKMREAKAEKRQSLSSL
jgi:hypothetical protein